MKKKNDVVVDNHNYDNEGNILPAFPTSEATQKDKAKTSVGFTILAYVLQFLVFVPMVVGAIILAIYCYKLVPYYSFWPFVGTILVGLFAIIFYVVSIVVSRKNSKSSIRTQTVKILITFVCLTTLFGTLITYVFPDVIAFATQNTLYCEDLFYNAEAQAEENSKLERDFIRNQILAGNMGHELSYYNMNQHQEDSSGVILSYDVQEIDDQYNLYLSYGESKINSTIKTIKETNKLKYELYEYIYNNYVLIDFDYAFLGELVDGKLDASQRHAITLAMVDYIYDNGNYEQLIKEGFNNKEIKRLFDTNFDAFNQDGYLTFDDPPLLYAQVPGRMTIPMVLRLILDEPWTYTQPGFVMDEAATKYNWASGEDETVFFPEYYEDTNYLLEMYDPKCWESYEALGLSYPYESEDRKLDDGSKMHYGYYINSTDINDKYNGWIVYEDGTVKRPAYWLVLDMLGDPMSLASVDLASDVGGIVMTVLGMLPEAVGAIGDLLTVGLTPLLEYVTDGASLTLALYMDDNAQLQIGIVSNNVYYAMLGYMQASWVQQDSLLFAVITVIGSRNWLLIFSGIGAVLVIAAGVLRDCAKKTREKTQLSQDRILREKAAEESGITIENTPPTEAAAE